MKRLFIPLLVAITSLLVAVPVLAAYYVDIDVTESDGISYDMLPVLVTMPIDYLAEHEFISENGTDVRVKDSQGDDVPFMLAGDRVAFASDITGDMVNRFQLTTGNTPIDNFAVCTGGGYITIPDHANLELGSDFEVAFDGWVDTFETSSYPDVAGSNTSTETSAITGHNVSLPSGIEAGNLLLVVFSGYCSSGIPTITWPADWINLDKFAESTRASGVAYKIASGTEASTITVTTAVASYSAHHAFRVVRGIPEISSRASGATANPNSPSLSPSWGSPEYTTWFSVFAAGDTNDRTLSSYPANYTNGQFTKTDTYNAYVGSARRELEAASEDPGAFTLSGTAGWSAWTIAVRDAELLIDKFGAFRIYAEAGGSISAGILGGSPKILTTTGFSPEEYEAAVWGNSTHFGIDVNGVTQNITTVASVPDTSNDWIISMPYFNYYTHTTNDTLRITYEPCAIIEGTTLPNEENPGTYDGTITWGSNPSGIDVSHSALQLEETYYVSDIETSSQDIFEPEPAEMTSDVNLERLENNPLNPAVEALAEASNGQLTERLIWLGGAWIALIVILIFVFFKTKENIVFTCLVGVGLSALFYVMGIFNYGTIILFGIGAIAAIIHERMPTW